MGEQATRLVSRRNVLVAGGALACGYSLSACDILQSTPASNDDAGDSDAVKEMEAPMLATRVSAGELPAVEERLPRDPLVVKPNERIGRYGGDWNTVLEGGPQGTWGWIPTTVGYEGLMRWDPQYTELRPNVARDYEISEDGTQITLMLREGMKWSDGEPFTADDLTFVYNDVMRNPEIRPGPPPQQLMAGGEPPTLEKLDDYTVRFTFAVSHGLFLQYLATPPLSRLVQNPRHYLEQFHKDYNPDVDQLVESEGQEDWVSLFEAKRNIWENPELPRLHPWVPTGAIGSGPRVVFERNPYYWKVDPDGSQLPYLDRVVFDYVNEHDVSVLRASNGELDMEVRRFFGDTTQKPVLAAHREDGGFRFLDIRSTYSALHIALNLTHKDPVKREIFQNRDFRVGCSLAIDRQELIDTAFKRQGEPFQVAPRPDSPHYDEEMAKQYTEYDVDQANAHLDRAGYTERGSGGIRLGPDGEPISFAVIMEIDRIHLVDSAEVLRGYLLEVGIDMRVTPVARELFYERKMANEHDATVRIAEGGASFEPPLRPHYWFPSGGEANNYAALWSDWFVSNGEEGEEPPEEVRRQMEIYEQDVWTAQDEDQRIQAMRELLAISKQFFYHIGVCLVEGNYGIVSNDFHNVPPEFPMGWYYPSPGPTNPEQYFKTVSS